MQQQIQILTLSFNSLTYCVTLFTTQLTTRMEGDMGLWTSISDLQNMDNVLLAQFATLLSLGLLTTLVRSLCVMSALMRLTKPILCFLRID
jgi:hypothetical protein